MATTVERNGQKVRIGTVVIANGAPTSDPWVNDGHRYVMLEIPAIDNAVLTFDVARSEAEFQAGTWSALYDAAGNEYTLGGAANTGSRAYSDVAGLAGVYAFRVRTGTHAAAVNQTAARTIGVQTRN